MKFIKNIKRSFNLLFVGFVTMFIVIMALVFVTVDNLKTMSQLELRIFMLEKSLLNDQKHPTDVFYPVSSMKSEEYDNSTFNRLGIMKNTLYSIDNTLKRINDKVGYLNGINYDYSINDSDSMIQEIGFNATVTDSDLKQYLDKQNQFQNELLNLLRAIQNDTSYIRFLR